MTLLLVILGVFVLVQTLSNKKQIGQLRQQIKTLNERLEQFALSDTVSSDPTSSAPELSESTLTDDSEDFSDVVAEVLTTAEVQTEPQPVSNVVLATLPQSKTTAMSRQSDYGGNTTFIATPSHLAKTPSKKPSDGDARRNATVSPTTKVATNVDSNRKFSPQPDDNHSLGEAGGDILQRGVQFSKTWLSSGNIPVKVGMLVLIAAVIALLRYATNQGWLNIPVEMKLLGIGAAAIAALGFAWVKRDSKRSFSLSVQGGSIGILLLVIFAAVKMYGVIPPSIGFIFSIATVILVAVLAVQQDAKVLAVMAIFAGFLAPVWLSDGTGNHVVLFSYYAILNVGIFIVAWQKPWRELNLLGFIFTYVIGSTWGGLRYEAAQFASTEPFVILFFCFYLFIPLRYAQRQRQGDKPFHGKIDSALLFGTPLVTLGLHTGMLYYNADWLALSCVGMGLIYAVLAWWLRHHSAYETLQKAYVGLAAGFITLAIPIGLSAKSTVIAFALEGAGAVWLGAREKRFVTWSAGLVLQLLAVMFYLVAYLSGEEAVRAVANAYFLNAILIAVAAGISAWICGLTVDELALQKAQTESEAKTSTPTWFVRWLTPEILSNVGRVCFIWAMLWWLGAVIVEIFSYAPSSRQIHDVFTVVVLTAFALLSVYRYYRDQVVITTLAVLIMSGLGFALLRLLVVLSGLNAKLMSALLLMYHPITAYQIAVWILFAIGGVWLWQRLSRMTNTWVDIAVAMWYLALATTLSTWIYQLLPNTWVASGYYWWAVLAVWLSLASVVQLSPHWLTNIGQRDNTRWLATLSFGVYLVLLGGFACLFGVSGGDGGWWLPLLNSVELLQMVIVGLLLVAVLNDKNNRKLISSIGCLLIIPLIITVTWRMFNHWVGGNFSEITDSFQRFGDWYYLAIFGFWVLVASAVFVTDKPRLTPFIPRGQAWRAWLPIRRVVFNSLVVMLTITWFYMLMWRGDATPLPWLPLLNPLAILQGSILPLVWLMMRRYPLWFDKTLRSLIIPALIFVLFSVMTLRLIHHSTGITWGTTMLGEAVTQMSLTVVWSILGMLAWIIGSRRVSRPIWSVGALLMAVVLLKLIIIDRGHLGNLFGILSFFAYGLLCVFLGYFAPVPPSANAEDKEGNVD